jgi:tRNA-2-methylthio-N6-dimethylallyladenosine synthase
MSKLIPQTQIQLQYDYINKVKQYNGNAVLKYYVETFGCQQNEADSEKLSGILGSMGYVKAQNCACADIILINTCAIREHAELKALSVIGEIKHIKAKNPNIIVAVCGCMVTQDHRVNDIKFKFPYVDFTFGTSSIHRLPEFVYNKLKQSKRFFCSEEDEYLVSEGFEISRDSTYRAWVSIMYGCNNFCSYCIVPYVRGRERSREPKAVIDEVRGLVAEGYRDITLLGQNVNSYGKDSNFDYDFADLLQEIARLDGDFTVRFMTSHPKDATQKLIDVMAQEPKIAKHFHLPLQSGSDSILKKMNRHYNFTQYKEKADYLKEKIKDITITSDIIVGFPGESNEDFEDTIKALQTIEFDMLYSFIYSPRKGTPAYEMEDQVPKNIKNERFDRLLKVQNDISLKKNEVLVGQIIRVLCDGESKGNAQLLSGRTDGNKIVFFKGDINLKGSFINLEIQRAEPYSLYGEIIK